MKGVYRRAAVRPHWQRDFLVWFRAARGRFAMPVRAAARSEAVFQLDFPSLHPLVRSSIQVRITRDGLRVEARWRDHGFGFLAAFDVPSQRAGGAGRQGHQALFDLRRRALYEPFLEWVNSTLAPARWLCLWTERGRCGVPDADAARLVAAHESRRWVESALQSREGVIAPLRQQGTRRFLRIYMAALKAMCLEDGAAAVGGGDRSAAARTIAFLQRRLKVRYCRAIAVLRALQADGVLPPACTGS